MNVNARVIIGAIGLALVVAGGIQCGEATAQVVPALDPGDICPDTVTVVAGWDGPGTVKRGQFAPRGATLRSVDMWFNPTRTQPGPLVFCWHPTGGDGLGCLQSLVGGSGLVPEEIPDGAIIVAPSADPANLVANPDGSLRYPWWIVNATPSPSPLDDFRLADVIAGCLATSGVADFDAGRVHSVGFSAGGIQTTYMSYLRSNYLASAVSMSGGLVSTAVPQSQDPENLVPALLTHGLTPSSPSEFPQDPDDVAAWEAFSERYDCAGTFCFEVAQWRYRNDLRARGAFTLTCNTHLGHAAAELVNPWVFLSAHPFGERPWIGGQFPGELVAHGVPPTTCEVENVPPPPDLGF
jgi:predicted esterase